MSKFFDTIARYPHLFSPVATLVRTGTNLDDAPGGSLKLSKDPKLNLALWNAIFVGGAALPLTLLANTMINRKRESEILDSADKAVISKLEMLRPRLVSDDNLADTTAHTKLPARELAQLEHIKDNINKNASGKEKEEERTLFGDVDKWLEDAIGNTVSDTLKSAIPFAAVPAAVLGAIGISNYITEKRIKSDLAERRLQNKNIQAMIDRKRLQLAGLVKDDDAKLPKQASAEGLSKYAEDKNTAKTMLIDVPLLGALLVSGGLGIGLYNVLKNNDKAEAIVNYLKKKQLGSNALQSTPEISVLDLPARPDEVLAVPGDVKQVGLLDTNKPVALLENKELFTEVGSKEQKNKEKDAIF